MNHTTLHVVSILWITVALIGIARQTSTSRWLVVGAAGVIAVLAWTQRGLIPTVAVGSVLVWVAFGVQQWLQQTHSSVYQPDAAPQQHVYRPDIDGLRAIAIVPVVLYHAFPKYMPGGFIGVDIFFVISGFLITQILLEQHQRGTFTYRDFYIRRARRIFPALSVVLLSVLIVGWFVLFADEYGALSKHLVAGTAFVSNILSYSEVDYFAPAVYQIPLLHLWSLGVEEQFYIIWPVIIGLFAKRPRWLVTAFVVIIVASFFGTQYLQHSDAAAAFYWPVARFWELAIGGIGAFLTTQRSLQPTGHGQRRVLADLSAIGVGLLLTGFALIDDDTVFPGVMAALPTIGAFCVIVSGKDTWFSRRLLAQPVLVFIGLISYPLYLWHWPLLSFGQIYYESEFTLIWRIAAVAAAVVLASATYALLERRVRQRVGGHLVVPTRVIVTAMVIVSAMGVLIWFVEPATAVRQGESTKKLGAAMAEVARRTRSTPCSEAGIAPSFRGRCKYKPGSDPASSDYVVIGDSLSMVFAGALLDGDVPHAVLLLGRLGCIPLPGMERYENARSFSCNRVGAVPSIFDAVRKLPTDRDRVIFVVGRFANIENRKLNPNNPMSTRLKYRTRPFPVTDAERERDYRDAATELFATLTALPRTTVVFVDQYPEFAFPPNHCVRRGTVTASGRSCTMPRAVEDALFARYRRVIDGVLTEYPQVQRIDPLQAFCDAAFCYAADDGQILYRDDTHPNLFGARLLKDEILRRFP